MTPIKVEPLYNDEPRLFAYALPSRIERANPQAGDMVKLFLQLEEYIHPRPIWNTVTGSQKRNGTRSFTGKIWDGYSPEKQRRFVDLEFDSAHIYRLPLNRPEIENPLFDSAYRDTKKNAG